MDGIHRASADAGDDSLVTWPPASCSCNVKTAQNKGSPDQPWDSALLGQYKERGLLCFDLQLSCPSMTLCFDFGFLHFVDSQQHCLEGISEVIWFNLQPEIKKEYLDSYSCKFYLHFEYDYPDLYNLFPLLSQTKITQIYVRRVALSVHSKKKKWHWVFGYFSILNNDIGRKLIIKKYFRACSKASCSQIRRIHESQNIVITKVSLKTSFLLSASTSLSVLYLKTKTWLDHVILLVA